MDSPVIDSSRCSFDEGWIMCLFSHILSHVHPLSVSLTVGKEGYNTVPFLASSHDPHGRVLHPLFRDTVSLPSDSIVHSTVVRFDSSTYK